MDKQSSDERLLKLIEGGSSGVKKPFTAPGAKKGGPKGLPGLSLKFSLPAIKAKLKELKINLFLVNKGLVALAVLLTLIFLYTLFSGAIISNSTSVFSPQDTSAIAKIVSADKAQGAIRKNILSEDIRRNFFLPPGSKITTYKQEEELDMTEELKVLKLVGIIWSKNPEIMIENTRDSRTMTFKKGDSLTNNIKIKDISRNSAVLEVATESGLKEFILR